MGNEYDFSEAVKNPHVGSFAIPDLGRVKIAVGRGSASFPMTKGSFQYDDQVTEKRELSLEEARSAVSLQTSGDETVLHFHVNGDWNRFYLTIPADPEEHYYGCGETFSEFDLKGQRVRIWVAEHQNAERIERKLAKWEELGFYPEGPHPFEDYESYYAQPTVTSSNRWTLHVDTGAFAAFDFTEPGEIGIELWEEAPVHLIRADSFERLSEALSLRLGRVPELPDWVYDGVILGIQRGTDEVNAKLAVCERHGVPVTGVWCQDWCGCRRTGFGYQVMWNWEASEELYPDLKNQIAEWKKQGVHFLGYINPFLAIEKDLYREAAEKGYCVKNARGEDYLVTITTFPAAMVDFTNPEAYDWYKEVIKNNLIGIGMGGWMADFGEYLPVDAVLYGGEDAELLHNRWPAIWAKLNREAIEECGLLGEVFFFTRAGSAQTIRYSTMMWNGDQHVDWSLDDGLASVIPATLSLAMSGYGIAHSDAGGYTTMQQMTRGKELLMRWEEMNIFSPLMRTHEGNQPSRSIQFDADEELLSHLARCVRTHVHLKSYLKEAVQEEAEKGIPVMRPLFYHYDEPQAYTEKFEYLLGRHLLVAPVIREGETKRVVYLPQDEWIHLLDGKEYHGGVFEVDAPIGQPPVFVRRSAAHR